MIHRTNLTELIHRRSRRAFLCGVVYSGVSLSVGISTWADEGPNSSLYSSRLVSAQQDVPPGPPSGMTGSFGTSGQAPSPPSWYEIPVPPPKEVKVNDIITIRV